MQAVNIVRRRVVQTVFRVGFSYVAVIPAKGDFCRVVLIEIGDDAVFSASDGDDVAEHPVRVHVVDEWRYEQAVLVFADIQDVPNDDSSFWTDGKRPAADGFPDGGLDFAQQGIGSGPCGLAVDETASSGEQGRDCVRLGIAQRGCTLVVEHHGLDGGVEGL